MSIEIGDKAPDFTLPTDGGGSVTLSKLKGKKVVLYFYPKDDTSGCTAEACGFRDSFPQFPQDRRRRDRHLARQRRRHDKFKKKYELPFTLASDADGKVTERYGVWVEKSMYGRKYMGIERATFLIDEKGVMRNDLAQGEGAGPRRRGAGGREGAVSATLAAAACAVLRAPEPADKVALTRAFRRGIVAAGELAPGGGARPPDRPARPARPELQPPRDMPRRRAAGSRDGPHRAAACAGAYRVERHRSRLGPDRAVRRSDLPREFFDDWVGVAAEEAKHFALLCGRLAAHRRALWRSSGA